MSAFRKTAAGLMLALTTATAPAIAAPAVSWSSDDVSYPRHVCMRHAERALAMERWSGIARSGSLGMIAEKGPLSALILCVTGVTVVVVTGGSSDFAERERNRLQYHMTQE